MNHDHFINGELHEIFETLVDEVEKPLQFKQRDGARITLLMAMASEEVIETIKMQVKKLSQHDALAENFTHEKHSMT